MMDSSNAIFERDVVLSDEVLSSNARPRTPELELMLAVLEDAARCLLRTCTASDDRNRALYEETRDWFASTEHARLYDFENVCNVLGIEPDYFRAGVLTKRDRLRAAALAGRPSTTGTDAETEPERLRA